MSILFCTFVVQKETSSTTKPQAPEGHKIMNHELKENFLNFVQAVEKEAMLSTMNEIDTMLSKKQRFYRNLLYSDEAINIYLNMSDKNFLEVRRLRTNLQTKERLLEEIGGMIYEMKYNEITNKNH